MDKHDEPCVDVDQLFRGYRQGLLRLHRAVQSRDLWPVFFALFEALNWAVVLDDAIDDVFAHGDGAKWWRHDEQGYLLAAVRYVRNRVHHQWANALRLELESHGVLPFPGYVWVWRELTDLPSPDPNRSSDAEQDAYGYMVCRDRRVAFTLTDLEPIFQSGINQLAEQRRGD